jgi:hypothetical protein
MTVLRSTTAAAILALASIAPLFAQSGHGAQNPAPAPAAKASRPAAGEIDGGAPTYLKPETAEERKARLGTTEDPGPNPDEKKIFHRFGHDYHIEKYSRQWEAFDRVQEGWVRPLSLVNAGFELYQRNAKWNWVWVPEQLTPDPATDTRGQVKLTPQQVKFLEMFRPEFSELSVPDSPKTLRFEDASEGLPTSGSWRNSLAVADMNGDGFADIIAPPERGVGNSYPSIFLGDGKGHWRVWTDVKYPMPIDYGAVVAADFNRDGKMDLAFGIHLTGVRVWLGDGKGNFTDSSKDLPVNSFPTRKIIATDVDRDGLIDIVAITEGATRAGITPGGHVRVFLNRKKGAEWQQIDAAGENTTIAGDTLAAGNFNGDKYPDFVGGSVYFQATELLWLSDGPKKWKLPNTENAIIGTLSSYNGVATGHFSSKKLDDAIVGYGRAWPMSTAKQFTPPEVHEIAGLDLITFTNGEPKRKAILRYANPKRAIAGIATGDFDGDGNEDIAYVNSSPKREMVILLGDGKGGFTRAHVEGLKAEEQTNYDLRAADVNGDSRPDLIVMYESDKQGSFGVQNGSIHVFLNRGPAASAPAKK